MKPIYSVKMWYYFFSVAWGDVLEMVFLGSEYWLLQIYASGRLVVDQETMLSNHSHIWFGSWQWLSHS